MKRTTFSCLFVILLVFCFLGCDSGNGTIWIYSGPKTITITGLDTYEGYNIYAFLRENTSPPSVAGVPGTDYAVLVTSGTISIELWEHPDYLNRWTGSGEYFVCIGVMFGPPRPHIMLYRTTVKVNIKDEENTTINYSDYTWVQT